MRIGIITYYRVANFGANLQAVSTYRYLEQAGHEPIFIHYMSRQLYEVNDGSYDTNPQVKAHLDFVDSVITRQTETCFTADDVNRAIEKHGIEAIIIGSDAVLQHHPLLSRIHVVGRRVKRLRIEKVNDERMFPNLFWGCGITPSIKKALMSVSSQNSAYRYISSSKKRNMRNTLNEFSFISVRDTWAQKMVRFIADKEVPITPDPVFAFRHHAEDLIPSKEHILTKFGLPEKYILVSFLNVHIPSNIINGLKDRFGQNAYCVALPSPLGLRFSHNYDYEIALPLSPIDWYALIAHSCGYIGNNMHPVVVALSNGVPCFSIDNYSNYNFWSQPIDDGASKIEDLLKYFNLQEYRMVPYKDNTDGLDERIAKQIMSFPKNEVLQFSEKKYNGYITMMDSILNAIRP